MSTVREVIERLQHYDLDAHVAVSLWSTDDVLCMVDEDDGLKLTQEQANKIIDDIDHHHDASIGINWEVIRCHIDFLEQDLEDTKENDDE